jgi:histidine triad (HIT) family protein
MFNYQPADYVCPFCNLIAGVESEHNQKQDIVYQNEYATASIAPKWWINNPGHVLVVPNAHYENLYDIPDEALSEVYKVVKKVAIAIRSNYGCDGTSTRQHNEPAGNQEVCHLHVHVFPRYEGDNLYINHALKKYVSPAERAPYAQKLRDFLEKNNI